MDNKTEELVEPSDELLRRIDAAMKGDTRTPLPAVVKKGINPPSYAHAGDAGLDLCVAEDVWIHWNETKLVGTGVKVAIPEGHVGLIFPRSSLNLKRNITLGNSVAVIDAGFRGEMKLQLFNLGKKPQLIHKGERVAQLVVMRFEPCRIELVEELDETDRGENGFGSSGQF